MTKRKAPKQTERFIAVTARARRLLQGKPRAAEVYTDLLARCGPRASVQVRHSTIAAALGVHVNTVGTAIAVLKDLGLVEVRRTVRAPFHWLPEHPGYAADLDAYEARKAANAAKKAGVPHIESQHPHIDPQQDGHRSTTDCGSGTTTDCGSISIDVPSYEGITNRCSSPSGARPSGPGAPSGSEADPAGPPAWAVPDGGERQGQEPKKAPAAPHLRKNSPTWYESSQRMYPDYVPVPADQQVPDLVLGHGWVWVVYDGHHVPKYDFTGWKAQRPRVAAERIF